MKFDPLGMVAHPSRQVGQRRPSAQVSTKAGTFHQAIKAAGLQLALLSNMPRMQWSRLESAFPWLQSCDIVMLSYRLRVAKPDPAIYQSCLERLGLAPADVLFIDDRPENIDVALELGLGAVLFTSVEALRTDLKSRFDDRVPILQMPSPT